MHVNYRSLTCRVLPLWVDQKYFIPRPPPAGALLSLLQSTRRGEEEREKQKHSSYPNRRRLNFPVLVGRPRCPGQVRALLPAPSRFPQTPGPVAFPPPLAPAMEGVGPRACRDSPPSLCTLGSEREERAPLGGPTHLGKRRTSAGRPLPYGCASEWGGEERVA